MMHTCARRSLQATRLSGTLPSTFFGALSKVHAITLRENALSGTLPADAFAREV